MDNMAMFGYTPVQRFLVKPIGLTSVHTLSEALRARFSAGAAISDAT